MMSGPKVTNTNVTTVVHDENTAPDDLLTRSDDYNGNGSWQASYDNSGGITSLIFSGSGWQLYLGNQSVRRIWLTLSQPANGSNAAPAPDGYYSDSVEVYSRCWDANNQEVPFLAIAPATSQNRCSFGVDFAFNGVKYKLVMQPSIPGLLNTSGTGWATVSCNSSSGTTCNSWTIFPNVNAGNGNVPTIANLYQYTRRGTLNYIGSYYNTYRIDVTNP
jgi:hypothetical protein